MMRVFRWLLWGVGAFLMYIALVILLPLFMPALSIVLPRPSGFPLDARVVKSDFQDGSWWAYCRPLPSGFMWVSAGGGGIPDALFSLSYGGRCDLPFFIWKVRSRFGNLTPSLENPAFTMTDGWLGAAVPIAAISKATCPSSFDPAYYEKALKIIAEAEELQDDAVRYNAKQFEMARETLKDPGVRSELVTPGEVARCYVAPRKSL